ncbi:MAG TPA: glycosyltransferase 87 family protein [Candidatus Thermoplasmatota archaeon]|nr:glycosyltransferase 87 family protein [Candidatus Thermoplasmatota archaeon]
MPVQAAWRAARAWLAGLPRAYWYALAAYLVLAAVFIHDWDGFVFRTAARQIWGVGAPWSPDAGTPYQVAEGDPWYGFLNPADRDVQWYAYPPLPLLLMAGTYAPAVFLDLPPFVGRILIKVPAILGTLALAYVAGQWARRLDADAAEQRRIQVRFLANPFLVLVGPVWGMTDTLLMALYMGGLLAYAQGRPGKGGVLVALSILVKPFPLLLMLAIAPYLLVRDGRRPFFRFTGAAAATGLLVSLPFLATGAHGYWSQAVGAHLARDPQGLTIWSLWPLDQLPPNVISGLSLSLMALALLAIGFAATRLRGRGTSLVLTMAAAAAVLAFNRVVNEQYLVLVVAPMLILDVAHRLDRFGHWLTRWTSWLFAAAIVLVGFHFLTFIPPDVAALFLPEPVDYAAHVLRTLWPAFWAGLTRFLEIAVPLTIAALGILAVDLMRSAWVRSHAADPKARVHLAPTLVACLLLLAIGIVPLVQPSDAEDGGPFEPAYEEASVAAFYYLWWQNPSHDPAVEYGNWPPVSQVPEMGYYTNTRGVAREHVRMMVENGIDTAIVSYHRGEQERYRVFQEEAHAQGLWVVPLIELNQVYDQPIHHPVNENGLPLHHAVDPTGKPITYAAYRLDDGTRRAIEGFVLDLADQLAEPSTLRLDGRPVVMFYDSYVSSFGFHAEDMRSLAQVLWDTTPTEVLREAFGDPAIEGPDDLLRHYPTIASGFYDQGSAALWRRAHLADHVRFWETLRAELEARTGPLFLVSGDAMNERAGFEASTVKALVGLEAFDGSFVYSPSFTWGNQPKATFNDTFSLWEDRNLWLASFARSQGSLSSTGVAPAYDDTVNRPNGFRIPALPPGNGTFYERSWASVTRQGITFPAVATFNEFFEGSSIEPSLEYGDRFLRDTGAQRSRHETAPVPSVDVAVVVHERSSRTSLLYSETDLSHFWGLDLLGAASRAIPDSRLTALDALEPRLADMARPDLILVEGGRGQFETSSAVYLRMQGWSGETPVLVFGPDKAQSIAGALGDDCLPGLSDVPDPKTLQPGDRLVGGNGSVRLERGGVSYVVGQVCQDGLRAGTSVKPWVATEPITQPWGGLYDAISAQCTAVTLRALMPQFAAPDAPTECHVVP